MARFHGVVGYGVTEETRPGVHEMKITERPYYGDVVRNLTRFTEEQKLNLDLAVSHSISIVADAFANEHIFAIRYVKWAGALWSVNNVEIQSPRLLLRLGGLYDGPTP